MESDTFTMKSQQLLTVHVHMVGPNENNQFGASSTRCKGLEKQKLKEFILQHLREFGPTPRVRLEELLFEMLPADLTEKKKRNKVKNLLTEMRAKDKTIKRIGKGPKSKWIF